MTIKASEPNCTGNGNSVTTQAWLVSAPPLLGSQLGKLKRPAAGTIWTFPPSCLPPELG